MNDFLKPISSPELIFGLIGPVGVDLDLVVGALTQSLKDLRYQVEHFRLTELMLDVDVGLAVPVFNGSVASYRARIAYANAVRAKLGDEAMAALAISAIRS